MSFLDSFGMGQNTENPPTYPPTQSYQPPPTQSRIPRYEVAKVKGRQGVLDFPMGPNSSIFLADLTNEHRIWLAVTDAQCVKTITPLDCNVATEENISMADINNRLKRLEEMILNEQRLGSRSSKSKSAAANATTESES